MGNVTFSKPQHVGLLYYSYWDGAAWSTPADITDTFLNDTTKSHVGTVSGLVSLADNLVEKDRFIMYYGSYVNSTFVPADGVIDKIAMAGLSQISGLTFKTYADDAIAIGSVPTTLIDTTVQAAGSSLYSTKNDIITFTETTKECFMVERQGIASYDGGKNINLLINGDFEIGGTTSLGFGYTIRDPDSWTLAGSSGSLYNPATETWSGYVRDSTGDTLRQSVSMGSSDLSFKLALKTTSLGDGGIEVNGASLNYLTETATALDNLEYTFDVLGSETTLEVKFIGGTLLTAVANVELTVTSGSVYTGSPLDTGAIIFGGDALTMGQNFSNGAELDDSTKYESSRSGSRSFLTRIDNLRQEALSFELLTDAQKEALEDLDKELNEGLCIYQRDSASTDDEEWFIGRVTISPNRGTFTDINTIEATVTELVERV